MSTEKPNTSKPTPPPDWKAEIDKHWQRLSQRGSDFYQSHQQLFGVQKVAAVAGAGLLVAWLGSGWYIVDQGNRGVVSRFGAYADTTLPGLNWHWPLPLESVKVVNVEQQRFIEVGYRDSGRFAKAANIPQESLMLTRDENIINVRLAVQYQINNAKDYLFNVKDSEATLKQLTESVERAVIGQHDMDFVLTEGRSEIVAEIKSQIQTAMDRYQAGITIASVNLQDAQPPEEVQGAFEDAIRAREDKQRLINEAEAYSNEILPKARGASARLLQEADAYQAEKVAKAKGETERFDQLLVEYEKNPAITRKRLYLEAKEKLYSGSRKILIESTQNAPQFYMPLANAEAQAAGSKHPVADLGSPDNSGEAAHNHKAAAPELRPSRSKP
ncbi:FtsH protease activity modulator HflK [Methylomonas paludis]|uniref:Protein HflK n=1 Tax=Methylomonas paludis TaxID=1173101 RepID=A0A975MNX2_9GAMM|nr:FtsH protease activity modulator HflK [Methylomonas paludis]QWF71338.1 FtsH protease activity modulator HflK [Methylomonas paludis]